ncbi:TolC family protein [Desulforhabdus sp. TSK]|uniref:TolC family protein n=1 Tax=Desulforhabdus sp. TSK TaxID=2925014 RepID=UPI001FC7C426|nr:TolC family protein [Desulforhabdus sp. TSK]GKT10452.1 transporter [Desulforhabdus sp. TSK]
MRSARHGGIRRSFFLSALIFASVLLMFAAGPAVSGQESPDPQALPPQPLTIEGAVDFGLVHNPVFQAADEDLNAAKKGVDMARAGFLPRLDTSYEYTRWKDTPVIKIQGSPGTAGNEVEVSSRDVNRWEGTLTQPLFRGFGVKAQYEIAKEERNVAGFRKEETRLNLKRDIRGVFLQVLFAQRSLEVVTESVAQLEAHLRDAKALFRQGLTAENDVLKAEVALADAKQREATASKQLLITRARLNRLLGLDEGTELDLAEWDKLPSPDGKAADVPTLDALSNRAEKARPELSATSASIRETEQGARLARSSAYPHLSLFGTYYREGEDFLATENNFANDNNAAVGIRMDWNLFEGGKMRAEASQWGHRREALKKREQDLLKQVRIEVKDSYEQLQVAARNLATARVAVKQAEENLRMTTLQYRQQVVISTEVLDSEVYLAQARTNYFQALYGYQLAWVDLERAVGESL